MRGRSAQIGPGIWSLNRDQPRSTIRDDRHGERSALEALAARRAAKHAAAFIASIQDGLVVVDESGRIADVNAHFVEMTAFGRHELIGQCCPYPFWAAEDRHANAIAFQQFLAMLRQAGTPSADLELTCRSKGGRRFPVTMRVAQLFGAAKELLGYVGTVKDVTSLRRAEHELRSSQAQAPVLRDPLDVLEFDPLMSAGEQVSQTRRKQTHGGSLTLLRTIDTRDPGTLRRSEFVAEIAERLALELGWAPKRASDLYEAGLVHKVGKMGLSDAILFKRAPMTSAERVQMERHPVLGAEVLAGSLSEEQVTWVRHHHESFDGTGYPDGLKGEKIPDGARILALADAWEAMTNGRDRQSARDHADLLADCQRQASRRFCPRAVDALVRLMSSAKPASPAGPVVRLDT